MGWLCFLNVSVSVIISVKGEYIVSVPQCPLFDIISVGIDGRRIVEILLLQKSSIPW